MSFYKSKISKYKPIKKLTKGFKEFGGRNNTGRITVAHKGGGHKRLYREIDFKRNYKSGIVINTEYDPNRSANIAKILDDSKPVPSFYYIIAPKDLQPLDKLYSNDKPLNEIKIGDTYPLHYFNVGDLVHNIELNLGQGGKLVRSAGTYAQVLQKPSIHSKYARLRLPSGEERLILAQCKATLGAVSNSKHRLRNIRKAGVSR
jgi:large subunit ribosomal protein L2